jgi:hypothetical protein
LLEGPEIEPLLTQVREEYGTGVRIISADKVRSGGLGGFFAKQRYELSVEVPDQPAAGEPVDGLLALVEAGESTVAGPADAPEPPPVTRPLKRGAEAKVQKAPLTPVRRKQPAPDTPPRAALVSTATATFAEVMATVGGAVGAPAPPTVPVAPAAVVEARPVAAPMGVGRELVGLGMPADVARRATGGDPYQAIVNALGSLPKAPAAPAGHGDVLVVAGELPAALALAQQVAATLGLDPDKMLVATKATAGVPAARRISDPADARQRARRMQVASTPHVVVLDAPVHGADTAWVRAVRTALAPTAIWAAVDATRKTTETTRHLRSLGPVDALGVYGAADCADPASVLGLDAPVAQLDGRSADPHAWAALLSQRLYVGGGTCS